MTADFYGYMDIPELDGAGNTAFMIFMIVYLVLIAFLLVYAAVVYVLQSTGLYSIAKRRGIHHPGLAWVPVANMWILGSISDQYQYVAKGKVRSRRKVLLGLSIAINALSIPSGLSYTAMLITGLAENAAGGFTVSAIFGSLFSLGLSVVTVIAMVFQYMATYDLYVSCDPGNATLYLVLSILFPVTMPFFIFACRGKDLGMPPRRAPKSAAPVSVDDAVRSIENSVSRIQPEPTMKLDFGTAVDAPAKQESKLDSTQFFTL